MKRQSIVYNNHLIIVEHRAMNKYKLIVSNPKGCLLYTSDAADE